MTLFAKNVPPSLSLYFFINDISNIPGCSIKLLIPFDCYTYCLCVKTPGLSFPPSNFGFKSDGLVMPPYFINGFSRSEL